MPFAILIKNVTKVFCLRIISHPKDHTPLSSVFDINLNFIPLYKETHRQRDLLLVALEVV